METITVQNNLTEWNGLDGIIDELILGPQATILNDLHTINNHFNSNFKITKTFRWSPGFAQEREKIFLSKIGITKKGKTSTYRNRINNATWSTSRLFSSLMKIEDQLAELRFNNIYFQNNGDLANLILSYLINKINSQIEIINTKFSNVCTIKANIVNSDIINLTDTYRTRVSNNGPAIALEWHMKPYTIEYYPSITETESISLPANETMILGYIPLMSVFNELGKKLSSNATNEKIELNLKKSYINTTIYGYYNQKYGLKHPYIRSRWNEPKEYHTENRQYLLVNTCRGDYNEIDRLISKFDLISATGLIQQWLSMFVEGRTTPLNTIKFAFEGFPKGMDNFNVRCHTNFNCFTEQVDAEYCSDINCKFKKTCLRQLTNDKIFNACDTSHVVDTLKDYQQDEVYTHLFALLNNIFPNDAGIERFLLDLTNNEEMLDLIAILYRSMLDSSGATLYKYFYKHMTRMYNIDSDNYGTDGNLLSVYMRDKHDSLINHWSSSKLEQFYFHYDATIENCLKTDSEPARDDSAEDTREADMMTWLRTNGMHVGSLEADMTEPERFVSSDHRMAVKIVECLELLNARHLDLEFTYSRSIGNTTFPIKVYVNNERYDAFALCHEDLYGIYVPIISVTTTLCQDYDLNLDDIPIHIIPNDDPTYNLSNEIQFYHLEDRYAQIVYNTHYESVLSTT